MIIVEAPPKGLLGYEFYRMAIIALSDITMESLQDPSIIKIIDCQLFSAKIKNIIENDLVERNLFFTGNDKKNIVNIARLLGIKSAKQVTAYDLLKAYAEYVKNNCGEPPQKYRNIMYPNIFKLNYYEFKRDFSSKPSDVRGDLHQIMLMILGALIAKTGISRKSPRRLIYYTMIPELALKSPTRKPVQDYYLLFKSFRGIIRALIDEPEHIKRMALIIEAALRRKQNSSMETLDAVYQAITSEQRNRATLVEYNIISISDELSFFSKLREETLLALKKIIELYIIALQLSKNNKIMAKIADTLFSFMQYLMLYIETRNPDYAYHAIAVLDRVIINPVKTKEYKVIDGFLSKNMGPHYGILLSSTIKDIVDSAFSHAIS